MGRLLKTWRLGGGLHEGFTGQAGRGLPGRRGDMLGHCGMLVCGMKMSSSYFNVEGHSAPFIEEE